MKEEANKNRHGWLPAAWTCHLWRSLILANKDRFRIPVVLHNERVLAVLESLSPLHIHLYIDEGQWTRSEPEALRV